MRVKNGFLLVGVVLFALGLMPVSGLAGAPASASSANISHPYKATVNIPDDSLVVLDSKHSDYIQLANTDNASRLLGVAVSSTDSLLAVDASRGTTQVATGGSASVLVSTVNGDIQAGDEIGASPFNGVGMKAASPTAPGTEILGLAQTALSDHTPGVSTQTVLDKSGKSRQVKLGLVRVNISVRAADANDSGGNLTGPQRLIKLITGHKVSTARALISLVVAIVALLSLVTLTYASIYGSIISIGRNPLAKYAIFRTLGSVLGMAMLTVVVAGVILFLLLR